MRPLPANALPTARSFGRLRAAEERAEKRVRSRSAENPARREVVIGGYACSVLASALSRRTSPPRTPSRGTPPALPVGGTGGCPVPAPRAARPVASPHRRTGPAHALSRDASEPRRWRLGPAPRRNSHAEPSAVSPGRALVGRGTWFAACKRVERSAGGTRIERARAPFAAARTVGRARRFAGAARSTRVFFMDPPAGATCFVPALQQLPAPSLCVVGGCAALASALVPD